MSRCAICDYSPSTGSEYHSSLPRSHRKLKLWYSSYHNEQVCDDCLDALKYLYEKDEDIPESLLVVNPDFDREPSNDV